MTDKTDVRDSGLELVGELIEVIQKIQSAELGVGLHQEQNGKFSVMLTSDKSGVSGVFVNANMGESAEHLNPENEEDEDEYDDY